MDERPTKIPMQELAHSQDLDENTDVPDAADYQAPFGEAADKMSESALLNDMKKQLDHPCSEKVQGRDEMKRELDELREEMREERRQEIHEIREEIKTLIDAVEQIADNTKGSVKEN